VPAPAGTPVVLAAWQGLLGFDSHFNGRLEGVTVYSGYLTEADLAVAPYGYSPDLPLTAHWNFSKDIASSRVVDEGPHAAHGTLLQSPARAVPGHNWSGREVDHRQCPDEYGAIHFHDDDVADLGWEVDLDFEVPTDLESGVYAFRLRDGAREDHVPFFVRPSKGQARAKIAVLIPTFSYLAYANERISAGVDFVAAGMTDRTLTFDRLDEILARHPEFGVSMYDHHSDGSGVIHSSWRRPILNLRPRYRWWLSGAPQYLGCDLYIVDWLTQLNEPFDVVTDHCLHEEGASLLERYEVVITSSHPEYSSYTMMKAFEDYTQGGGRLMYLGGNGFYWVTSLDPEQPHVIEVRRGMAGTRAWESAPGEEHHSTTGERGGLWRHRGWAPNRVAGVGFSAQGWSRKSPGYRVNEAARIDPRTSWIFEGVNEDVIGDFGLIMGGAAGDELDRVEPSLGTPRDVAILASSWGHGPYYLQVHEDAPFSHAGLGGDVNPNVRADLVYFETSGGGAVFSVGSKAWVGSIPWNGYENNVARLTTNVLRGMLSGPAVR
jgi:N,N-dimethylformamidase